MERPDNCPDKIYEIMQQCWEHRPSKRPSFFKIIRTLLDHVNTDSGGYISHFREVSYFFSNEGTQENEKDQAGEFFLFFCCITVFRLPLNANVYQLPLLCSSVLIYVCMYI